MMHITVHAFENRYDLIGKGKFVILKTPLYIYEVELGRKQIIYN